MLESGHRQCLADPVTPFRGSDYPAPLGRERGSPGPGPCRGYLLGAAARIASAQPGQSLAQLVHVHAAVLVTVQLLEEATPALPPLRVARTPPHGALRGGRGGPAAAASAGASPLPLPPGAPQGQLRCHRYRSLRAASRALALAGGGDC